MSTVAQANIERFELLLQTEANPVKRRMIVRLLAELREEKLKAAKKPE